MTWCISSSFVFKALHIFKEPILSVVGGLIDPAVAVLDNLQRIAVAGSCGTAVVEAAAESFAFADLVGRCFAAIDDDVVPIFVAQWLISGWISGWISPSGKT